MVNFEIVKCTYYNDKTRSKPSIWLDRVWSIVTGIVSSGVNNVNLWILNVHLQFSVVVPVIFVLTVY